MRRSGSPGISKLGRLIVLWDDNSITIDGSTVARDHEDVMARFAAAGWHVQSNATGTIRTRVAARIEGAQRRPTARR